MLRRLPILLVPILACTSCNTFFAKLADPGNETMDGSVADAVLDVGDTNPSSDMDVALDADGADASDADGPADADPADLPGDPDLGPVSQLPVFQATCSVPDAHVGLYQSGLGLSGDFGREVSLAEGSGGTAELAWVQSNSARRTSLNFSAGGVSRGAEIPFSMDIPDGNVLGAVIGTGNDLGSQTLIWGASATRCSGTSFFWGGVDDMVINNIPCPGEPGDPVPQLLPMEVGGGWNSFTQTTSGVTRRIVYLSDEGIVGSLAENFAEGDATSSPAQWGGDPFLLTTGGRLAFFPDPTGRLMAWDTNQSRGSERAPVETPITGVERLGIDVEVLSDDQYVIAREVGGDSIVLELWEFTLANNFEIVGHWLTFGGLSQPDSVEVATFDGGFALWYQETFAVNDQRWVVRPFSLNGADLTEHDCPYVYPYDSAVVSVDNDLIAYREDTNLQVRGAVLFHFEPTPSRLEINVEGPFFQNLFQ